MASKLEVLVDVNVTGADKFKTLGQGMADVGKKASTFVTLPLLAAGAASFKFASDLDEASSKAATVYGAAAGTVVDASESMTDAWSQADFLDTAGTFGALLTNMGFTEQAAADQSVAWLQLAQDMGSFHNADPTEALGAIRSALAGEFEPLKRFGVMLNVATVEQKALEMGLWDGVGSVDAHTRAIVINAELMRQQPKVLGDYERTAGGAANSTRNLTANFTDAAAALGQQLIPIGIQLIGMVNSVVQGFKGLSPEMQSTIVKVAAVAAAIGPILWVGGKLIGVVTTIASAFGLMRGAIVKVVPFILAKAAAWGAVAISVIAANAPLLIIIGIIAAVVAALVWAYNNVKGFRDIVDAAFRIVGQVASALGDIFRRVFDAIGKVVGAVMGLIRGYFDNILFPIFRAVGAGLSVLGGVFSRIFDGIRNAVSTAINAVLGVFRNLWSGIQSVGGSIMSFLGKLFQPLADSINKVLGIVRGAWNAFARIWNGIQLNIPRIDIPNPFGGFITLGGGSIGLPDIPTFAKGGILTGPTLGVFGEAGPEAVIPLSRAGALGGSTYNITVQTGVGDPVAIGREIVDAIRAYERANGPVLA